MEKMIVLLLIALCHGGSGQETTVGTTTEEAPEGIETAACVFGCLETFERKGVQGESTDLPTIDLEGSICEKFDLTTLVGMCSSYAKAGTCIGGCVSSPTKKIITSGLDYICIRRLEDFKRYMSCFKRTCPTMEHQCGTSCGMDLAKAQEQWLDQLGVNGSNTTPEPRVSRRRRQASDTSSDTPTKESNDGSSGDEPSIDAIDTCQFVNCYMNCSRPIMEKECGKDAYDLLRHTSNILLSFVMAPLEESWEAGSNTSLPEPMSTCDRYFSQALTDEGVDKSVLRSATSRPAYNIVWSVPLISAALVLVFRF